MVMDRDSSIICLWAHNINSDLCMSIGEIKSEIKYILSITIRYVCKLRITNVKIS